jgi:hypothetical protein
MDRVTVKRIVRRNKDTRGNPTDRGQPMRFGRHDECDVVTRISGPLHHYLGLRLVQDQGAGQIDPILEDLSSATKPLPVPLPPTAVDLVITVRKALQAANERLGTRYAVERILFCSSDQYLKNVYRELTESLVEHVSRKQHRLTHEPAEEASRGYSA